MLTFLYYFQVQKPSILLPYKNMLVVSNTFNPRIKNATLTKMSTFFDGWRKNSKYFLMIGEKIVYIIRTKSAYFYSQFCIRSAALRSASQLQILLVKKICTFNPYDIIYYFLHEAFCGVSLCVYFSFIT